MRLQGILDMGSTVSGMPYFFTIFCQNVEIRLRMWYDKNLKFESC